MNRNVGESQSLLRFLSMWLWCWLHLTTRPAVCRRRRGCGGPLRQLRPASAAVAGGGERATAGGSRSAALALEGCARCLTHFTHFTRAPSAELPPGREMMPAVACCGRLLHPFTTNPNIGADGPKTVLPGSEIAY
jgi:hypothetical protein